MNFRELALCISSDQKFMQPKTKTMMKRIVVVFHLFAVFCSQLIYAEEERTDSKDQYGPDREFACRSDMSLNQYLGGALGGSNQTLGHGLTKKEKQQVDAVLEILNNDDNSHLSRQDKYQAVMELCSEGRILEDRFKINADE